MNPRFPRLALSTISVTTFALAAACSPKSSVKPGAPVLTEMIVVQAGPAGTTVTPTTAPCAATVADQAACAPKDDTLCQLASAMNWCSCVADAMDTTIGVWSCPPFANVTGVIAIFDRLLDTAPFDVDGGAAAGDIATLMTTPASATTADMSVDYASNGSTTGLIFPIFGKLLGNLRVDGPSLLMTLSPALPAFASNTVFTVTLNPANVRAKDGTTAFTGEGLLATGSVTFKTAPFSATVAGPPAPPPDPDAGTDADGGVPMPLPLPDMTPATIQFTNFVDPEKVGTHVTVSAVPVAGGAATAVEVTFASPDGGTTVTVTPKTTWPASSTITITVDATTPDVLDETLGTAASATFTTAAQ